MDFLKTHWLRLFYFALSIIILIFALYFEIQVTKDQNLLNKVSYYGTIATVVGLIVTILEVAHNIRITAGIQKEARKLLVQMQAFDMATACGDCLAALDDTNHNISEEKFGFALKNFQYFRKTYLRISSSYNPNTDVIKLIENVELALQRATHSTASAPIPKSKKSGILEDVLALKSHIEKTASIKKDVYVPA